MNKKGCPYDNAVAEALFKTLKKEFVYPNVFESLGQLKLELFDYINWYNKVLTFQLKEVRKRKTKLIVHWKYRNRNDVMS